MKTACVLGGSGTIGHQLVKHLKKEGYWVRCVDINHSMHSKTEADQFILYDLRADGNASLSLFPYDRNPFDYVFMLAAQMGGAKYIFTKENDADIMYESALMNLNVARAASAMRVKKLFFSSSACAYAESLQDELDSPALKESTAWFGKPDSAYGIEKLFSEEMYNAFSRNKGLDIRIARFHNIFTPECHFNDDRAKAPAAICWKVASAKDGSEITILGDGNQQRSFLCVDECIEGVMRLMESDCREPINIGSDEMISINNLAKMIIDISGKNLSIKNVESNALGVRGRNSDNTLIKEKLGWSPSEPLRYGITRLYNWVNSEVHKYAWPEYEQLGK